MTTELSRVHFTVSRESILAYASISNDFNPIHVDPAFAAKSPMGGIIAHGTLSLNLIWQAIELTFGPNLPGCHILDIRFKAPVRENDIVEARGEQIEGGEYKVWVQNQDGLAVIEGIARIGFQCS
jgi:3-hydroxybutyryl-CoA dehydratase